MSWQSESINTCMAKPITNVISVEKNVPFGSASEGNLIFFYPCFLGTWMNAGSTFLKYRSILKEEAIEYILVIGSKGDGRPIKMDSEREQEKNGSPKLF